MVETGYIFIVGLPRTGTTLMRSLLNSSPEVGISMGEAGFFGTPRFFGLTQRRDFRQDLAEIGDIATPEGIKEIVDFFYTAPQNNFWGAIPKHMDQSEFHQELLEADNKYRTLFEVAMIQGAKSKPLRGEKTPANIYVIPTLVDWFPNTKIIHMFRDPRAVYVSEKRKYEKRPQARFSWLSRQGRKLNLLFELYSSLNIMLNWLKAIRLHYKYDRLYPGCYYAVRYEDLISEPETCLRQLCDFLGIEFIPEMLQQTVVNSSFVAREAKMKGFDTTAVDRWRQNIHPVINKWFILWCRKQLLQFGYQL